MPGREGPGRHLERWAGPDLQEALGFMGREKGSHLEDFNQGSEFVFPEDPCGCCMERRLDAGPAMQGGK